MQEEKSNKSCQTLNSSQSVNQALCQKCKTQFEIECEGEAEDGPSSQSSDNENWIYNFEKRRADIECNIECIKDALEEIEEQLRFL